MTCEIDPSESPIATAPSTVERVMRSPPKTTPRKKHPDTAPGRIRLSLPVSLSPLEEPPKMTSDNVGTPPRSPKVEDVYEKMAEFADMMRDKVGEECPVFPFSSFDDVLVFRKREQAESDGITVKRPRLTMRRRSDESMSSPGPEYASVIEGDEEEEEEEEEEDVLRDQGRGASEGILECILDA